MLEGVNSVSDEEHAMNEERLVYGFDPLCGWCYGFVPVMQAVRERFPHVPVELRMGGLVTGARVEPIARSRAYLERGMAEVERRASVRFGRAFVEGLLAEGTYVSNSEIPCRAIWAMLETAPQLAHAFGARVITGFYGEGLAPDDTEHLAEWAADVGADVDAWRAAFGSGDAPAGTQRMFAQAQAEGFTMYPTLAADDVDGRRHEVVRGFAPTAEILARLDAIFAH